MAKVWDHYEFTIGSHFLCAMINSDYSGLEDNEEHLLDAFIEDALRILPKDAPYHWHVVEDSGDEFGLCEVTNKRGDVEDVWLVFERDE